MSKQYNLIFQIFSFVVIKSSSHYREMPVKKTPGAKSEHSKPKNIATYKSRRIQDSVPRS